MTKVIFIFCNKEIEIECKFEEKMIDICKRFASKIKVDDINNFYITYNGYEINKKLELETYLNEEDKKEKNIKFFVYNSNQKMNKINEKKNKNLFKKNEIKYNDEDNLDKHYINKIKYKYKRNPNFKYEGVIMNNEAQKYQNNAFEVFICYRDNTEYIAAKNGNNYNIDIFSLIENKKKLSLIGHSNSITTIRYFINNNNKNEYLISADFDYYIIIWDVTNFYNIKLVFHPFGYVGNIYSCLLVFPYNSNESYIITSTRAVKTKNYHRPETHLYSLDNGNYIKSFYNTTYCRIDYLLLWYDKIKEDYNIIQFHNRGIIIDNIFKDNSFVLDYQFIKIKYICGFIYQKDNKDFLFSITQLGDIKIWNLMEKQYYKSINLGMKIVYELSYTIQWNYKYAIVSDKYNNALIIIDLEKERIISVIKGEQLEDVECIRKVNHPIYGECLLSYSINSTIKLWRI